MRRRLVRPVEPLPFPGAIERRYLALLRTWLFELHVKARRTLLSAHDVAVHEMRTDDWSDTVSGAVAAITFNPPEEVTAELRPIADTIDLYQAKKWNALAAKLVGVRGLAVDPKVIPFLKSWSETNAQLISSIGESYHAAVARSVREGVTNGIGSAALAKELEKDYALSVSRAKLIARTETAKLNGNVSQRRQEAIGIKEYEWRTVRDERVRKSHRVLQGMICRWDDPGVYRAPGESGWSSRASIGGFVGHPGQDFQCRCGSAARVEAFLDELLAGR